MKHIGKILGTLVVLIATLSGCSSPVGGGGSGNVVSDPLGIGFYPHVIIKNKSSRNQDITLKKAYWWPDYPPTDEMYLDFQTGEEDSPVSCTLQAGAEATLQTWAHARLRVEFNIVLSFLLTINGKNYAGWPADIGTVNFPVERFGLGYVDVNPDDLKDLIKVLGTAIDYDKYKHPELSSVLPAGSLEPTPPFAFNATYLVTITDNNVEIKLQKKSELSGVR
jgi:hypothetical protein